jgi:universal stress protein E
MNEHDKPAALDDEIIVSSKTLARLCGGEVHVFHAYDPRVAAASATANAYLPVSLPYDEIDKEMRERHGKRFYEIASYHGIEDERAHLVSGRTEDELPALATKLDATVVVMGAVARNRLRRLFVGATAERTMDRLPCDLLIIKPDWFQTPPEILK